MPVDGALMSTANLTYLAMDVAEISMDVAEISMDMGAMFLCSNIDRRYSSNICRRSDNNCGRAYQFMRRKYAILAAIIE